MPLPLMAFSPDGTAFAYGVSPWGGGASAQSLVLWDLARAALRTTLYLAPSRAAAAKYLALGPRGRLLVAVRDQSAGQIG
ncbi:MULTISPECIES: hypothetical protein [Streptomyces]|uniref:WD40 repeat domain-containing protein n=1 Tax=Streptomyces sviceus (strain ATCC 29083 / DSM 924 / JCM 4929 / NBRC 13980 / NCIMB 11184 / NRRL 5439 / UC 5370) TaxID=463191 RepID=D6XBF6_STRX2|nr:MULTISPECIES: hypothetical protein [Streptomyces]EFH28766.1 predicted protein [Streptomyces sviceus ATCC 29083]MYT07432.1 hypothetical protein [Streptomyces sp. SID5470]